MTPAASLVATLRARGVTLEPRGDGLAVRPVEALAPDELEALRRHKAEVLRLLTAPPADARLPRLDPAIVREALGDHPDPHHAAMLAWDVRDALRVVEGEIRAGRTPETRIVRGQAAQRVAGPRRGRAPVQAVEGVRVTGEPGVSPDAPTLAKALGPGRPCVCGRTARRGRDTCWFCADDVPPELKREARRGRRRALPATTADPDLSSRDARRAFREALAGAVLRDEVSPELASVAARLVDGQAKDEAQRPAAPARPILVEVARYDQPNGHEAPAG